MKISHFYFHVTDDEDEFPSFPSMEMPQLPDLE